MHNQTIEQTAAGLEATANQATEQTVVGLEVIANRMPQMLCFATQEAAGQFIAFERLFQERLGKQALMIHSGYGVYWVLNLSTPKILVIKAVRDEHVFELDAQLLRNMCNKIGRFCTVYYSGGYPSGIGFSFIPPNPILSKGVG